MNKGKDCFIWENILMESIIVNNNLNKGYVLLQIKMMKFRIWLISAAGKRSDCKNLLDKGYYLRKEVKRKIIWY